MMMELHEGFLAWGRYLSWVDMNRDRFVESLQTHDDAASENSTASYVASASHYFASLWVAVEGYKELRLRDNFVDAILNNPPGYADLLRQCRNGVYHFNPQFIEPRFQALHERIQTTYPWAHALRGELIRVFWQFPEAEGWSRDEANEWRDAAYQLLGWLPQDTVYMNIILIERELADAEAVLQRCPNLEPKNGESKKARIKFSAEEERGFLARWEAEHKNTGNLESSIRSLRESLSDARSDVLKQQQLYFDDGWLGAVRPSN
jgi:hypothetical protein